VPLRVGIFAHIWYADLAPEFAEVFSHIPGPYDLHISTSFRYTKQIQDAMSAKQIHIATMHPTPNIGRDIFPFICILGPSMKEYDVACFVHSKKSLHVPPSFGIAWRQYLLRNLLGTPETISTILEKFSTDKELGILYPDPFPPIIPHIGWAYDYTIANSLARKMGFFVREDITPEYSPGTMFWYRPQALATLWDLGLKERDFVDATISKQDKTIAQAIERLLTYIVFSSNYTLERYTPFPGGADDSKKNI
jgi:lipopolysaccharide biosynthesis protein